MIKINDTLSIDESELRFTYARSPGPGGQNVNKTATKTTLWFDVKGSPALTAWQRERIFHALSSRINREGFLRVVSWRNRTQAANRRDAVGRFIQLLSAALRPRRVRKKTRPSIASIHLRKQHKQHRSRTKELRRKRIGIDED